ncbi:MAG: c-type cytochrome [Gammaproteobacteria bacterium]
MKHRNLALACALLFSSGASLAGTAGEADIRAGEQRYVQCTGCHAPAYHRTGPMHCGLLGRKAGSTAGFEFTAAMKKSGLVWNAKTLDAFLRSPLTVVPGTSMAFAGVASEAERRQLIAFLATLTSENPVCR